LRLGPGNGSVKIGQEFVVGLRIRQRQELLYVGDFGEVALAEVVIGRDRKRAELGQTPRHILDVFVQAEDLHRHQDHRWVVHPCGAGEIAGHFAVAYLDLDVSGLKALCIGLDGLGAHGACGERIACSNCGRGGHEATARKRCRHGQSDHVGR
jgi:hypothetical protein